MSKGDGDERAFQRATFGQPVDQNRNGLEFAGLAFDGLLAEREAARRREGRDQMQWTFILGLAVAAARGLAVDSDKARPVRPGFAHPRTEGGGKQRRIDPVHQLRKPTFAGNAVMKRPIAAQKLKMRRTPGGDGLVVVAIGHCGADHQQQDLRQRMRHSPSLARIVDHCKMIEKRAVGRGKTRLTRAGARFIC